MENYSISRASIYNILGSAVPILATILTIPAYINILGQSRFGIVSLVWILFGFAGIFDLGLSRATTNFLSRIENDDHESYRYLFHTALQVNAVIGVFTGFIVYFLIYFFSHSLLSEDVALIDEARLSAPWIAITVPAITITSVLVGTLDSRGRFLLSNSIQSFGFVLFQLIPLLGAIAFGENLDSVAMGICVSRYLIAAIFLLAVFRTNKLLPLVPARFPIAKRLLSYGGWVSISNLASPIINTVDQFIISSKYGPAQLAPYSISYTSANKLLLFPTALSRAFFPRLSGSDAGEVEKGATALLEIVAGIAGLACVNGLLLAKPIFIIWLGDDVGIPAAGYFEVIMLGIWINSIAFVPYTIFHSSGKPGTLAAIHLAELFPFVILVYFVVTIYGISSAPYVWVFRVLTDAVLLFSVCRVKTFQLHLLWIPILLFCVFSLIRSIDVTYMQLAVVILISNSLIAFYCVRRIGPGKLKTMLKRFRKL